MYLYVMPKIVYLFNLKFIEMIVSVLFLIFVCLLCFIFFRKYFISFSNYIMKIRMHLKRVFGEENPTICK